MHRLKVVSFDKVLSEKENDTEKTEKSKNKSKRHHDHDRKIRHKILSTLKEIKIQRLKAHNATNTEEQVIKKDTGLRTAKKISLTSISEQFRLCTKGKNIQLIATNSNIFNLNNKVICKITFVKYSFFFVSRYFFEKFVFY